MINFLKKNRDSIIRGLFIIPIILVAIISISHVVSWYGLTNPLSWAIYLSVAVEIAAMVSLAAASVRIKGGVWVVFITVTLIQLIGNIFYSYKEIDVKSNDYKDWVEMTTPVYETVGIDIEDENSHKRILALLTGGMLPIISLASLHFFMKYENKNDGKDEKNGDIDDNLDDNHPKTESPVEEQEKTEDKVDETEEPATVTQEPVKPIRTQQITSDDIEKLIAAKTKEGKTNRGFSVNVVENDKGKTSDFNRFNRRRN